AALAYHVSNGQNTKFHTKASRLGIGPVHGLLDDVVKHLPGLCSHDISIDVAVFVDHKGGGEGGDAVGVEEAGIFIHKGGVGVPVFLQKGGDVLCRALLAQVGGGHPQHHQVLLVVA